MKIIITYIITFFLFGCSLLDKKTEVIVKQEPFTIIHPSQPSSAVLHDVTWKVLTPEIAERLIREGRDDFVFIALTPDDYESLSLNMQEIIRYMKEQKEIILYYRESIPDSKDE